MRILLNTRHTSNQGRSTYFQGSQDQVGGSRISALAFADCRASLGPLKKQQLGFKQAKQREVHPYHE